jgi:hypothetical protein
MKRIKNKENSKNKEKLDKVKLDDKILYIFITYIN